MYGIPYIIRLPSTAVTVQVDFLELLAPAVGVLVVHEVHITQSTEEGDTEAEVLGVDWTLGESSVTSGSGGASATPISLPKGHTAGMTAEVFNTTQMVVGTGTLTILGEDGFHVAAGYHYVPTPEARFQIAPSDRLALGLTKTPADSITFQGYAIVEEIGK